MFHQDKSKLVASIDDVRKKHGAPRIARLLTNEQLCVSQKRQAQIKNYQALSGLTGSEYDSFCHSLLSTLSLYLQDLPETRNSYFSGKGGFLSHAMSRCEASLQACRAYFINEDGQPAKELSKEQKLWLYCLFSAALLRGIGRLLVDLNIDMFDGSGKYLGRWDPLTSNMQKQGAMFYDYDFDKPNHDTFRRRVTLSLATKLMPQLGLDWLSKDKEIFAVWLALLDEDLRAAGTLGIILDKAESLTINKFFQDKHLEKYNEEQGKGAGAKFNAPQDFLDKSELGEIPLEGTEFIKWLTKNLAAGRLMINKAPLLAVPGGLLMCPEMFQLFVREHPQFKNWQNVQKAFAMMQLHSLGVNGSAEQQFTNAKTGMVHSGMVLNALGVVLPEQFKLILANGVIKEASRKNGSVISQGAEHMVAKSVEAQPMQALSAGGQWLTPGSVTQSILTNKQQG